MSEQSQIICFYHSADLDGMCSGAIVAQRFPNCELYGYDYGHEFPWDKVSGRRVIMVDVSLPIDDMKRLKEESSEFVWIDHHKSAIESAVDEGFETSGLLRVGDAACELAWEFFIGAPMPRAVDLLGRYDVWDHKNPDVLPFQYGARLTIKGVDDPIWDSLLDYIAYDKGVWSILKAGRVCLDYQTSENTKYARTCAFDAKVGDLDVIAINKGLANSQLFDTVYDPKKHHAMCCFYLNKRGQWRVSLYSTRMDVDCSVECKRRGGGGHKAAAGFIADDLSFLVRS